MEPVTIKKLKARDFMGLELLDLDLPATGVIELLGQNTHGKTSVLRAVDSVIVGQKACPDRAIRGGSKAGEVEVTFSDDVIARRRWTNPDERTATSLEVTKDNFKRPKPQEYMAELATVDLDPVAFVSLAAKAKTELVLSMTDFKGFDLVENGREEDRRRKDFEDLTRERDRMLPEIATDAEACALAPDRLVDIKKLSGQLAEATAHNASRQGICDIAEAKREAVESHEVVIAGLVSRGEEILASIEELRAALALNTKAIVKAKKSSAALDKECVEANRKRDAFTDRPTQKLGEQLATANNQNQLFHARERLNELKTEAGDVIEKRTRAELDCLKLVSQRNKALAAAVFPVRGLAYNVPTRSLLLNGFPLTQASDREQIFVAFQMMVAQAPPLRVATARHGSSLDSDSRTWLNHYAIEQGWQVLLEVVADERPSEENGMAPLGPRRIWVDDAKRAPVTEETETPTVEA